jgi:hypothetical protein
VCGQHHAPAALPPGKTRYPLYRRLGGPQGRSGRVRKISLPPGIDPRIIQSVASRYTDWAIPAPWFQLVSTRNNHIIPSRPGQCESISLSKALQNSNGSQASPACPSDKSSIQTSIEHRWNDTDNGTTEIRSLKIALTIKSFYTRRKMSSEFGRVYCWLLVVCTVDCWFPKSRKQNQLTFSGKYSILEGGSPLEHLWR